MVAVTRTISRLVRNTGSIPFRYRIMTLGILQSWLVSSSISSIQLEMNIHSTLKKSVLQLLPGMCVLWQAEETSLHPTRSHFLSQLTMLYITICSAQHFGRCNKKKRKTTTIMLPKIRLCAHFLVLISNCFMGSKDTVVSHIGFNNSRL